MTKNKPTGKDFIDLRILIFRICTLNVLNIALKYASFMAEIYFLYKNKLSEHVSEFWYFKLNKFKIIEGKARQMQQSDFVFSGFAGSYLLTGLANLLNAVNSFFNQARVSTGLLFADTDCTKWLQRILFTCLRHLWFNTHGCWSSSPSCTSTRCRLKHDIANVQNFNILVCTKDFRKASAKKFKGLIS